MRNMKDSEPLLSVRQLSVEFDTSEGLVEAVKGVSMDLYPGRCHGLVGESGSGKSVTALAIMRLLSRSTARISSGEVLFRHPRKGMIDLLSLSDKEMQEIRGRYAGMVFQEPMTSLNPVHRCGAQVSEVVLQHTGAGRARARQKALALFDEVQLPDPQRIYRAWPHELSGGQKQRVMIAMAMACDPLLLIADEPTTALDVTVQSNILKLIHRLRERHGMGVLFISHDLGVIHSVADSLSVMRHGRVVEDGQRDSVLKAPGHPYTKALLACKPPLDARPRRLAVVEDFLEGGLRHEAPVPAGPDKTPGWHKRQAEEPILEVKSLSSHFVSKRNLLGRPLAYHKAVDDISFTVYEGETLGLVGESGCGKTTLGRSIMQLIRARSGQVIYRGTDLARLSDGRLRRMRPKFQIIFQDPYASLTPGIRIGRAIMEPMRLHGILKNREEREERIMYLLERVGMERKHYHRYPHEFSGGQRQRICIARALAMDPEFIVCDESVSALDVSVQAQVLNLLNELKAGFDLTYIFISHDLSVVKYMSDRIMVMRDGRMVELNEADQLYASPQTEYTRQLIAALPSF